MHKHHNGKTQPITPIPRFERLPVTCQACKQPFENLVYEVVDNLVQLRCGNVLFSRAEIMCMNCGRVYYWNLRERDLEKLAKSHNKLLGLEKPYAPE
jgi:uncharacterized protein with PIN domain